jgi:AcrR family transcriptional regulator
MARPRTVSDDEILAATIRAMTRLGPVKLTLADVAEEAGLSPAALIKRFGSKRGLLLAVSSAGSTGMAESFRELRRRYASPLEALLVATTFMARHTKSAEELANHLAFLQIDVTDPAFREHMLVISRATLAGYAACIRDAIEARELRPCDAKAVARAVNAVVAGSLIAWAVFRKGSAERWVRDDVETVLAPYRVTR